jgi:hypothetical protein
MDYELVIIGMPTFGLKPPKAFNAIMARVKNLEGKEVIIFRTSRFRLGGLLHYMRAEVEARGGRVTKQANFRGLFRLGTTKAVKFGEMINNV